MIKSSEPIQWRFLVSALHLVPVFLVRPGSTKL